MHLVGCCHKNIDSLYVSGLRFILSSGRVVIYQIHTARSRDIIMMQQQPIYTTNNYYRQPHTTKNYHQQPQVVVRQQAIVVLGAAPHHQHWHYKDPFSKAKLGLAFGVAIILIVGVYISVVIR